jgi:hypothetical protein
VPWILGTGVQPFMEAIVKVKLNAIKTVGIRPIYLSRVDTIVRRVQRGQPLGQIIVNADGELLEGEHELHAARRLRLDEIDAVVQEEP